METENVSPERRESYLRLLDDPSPTVRQALLVHFATLGPAAHDFLQQAAKDPNRLFARHAKWYLEQLHTVDPAAEFRAFIRSFNYELSPAPCCSPARSTPASMSAPAARRWTGSPRVAASSCRSPRPRARSAA